jgi:hypothetical protein
MISERLTHDRRDLMLLGVGLISGAGSKRTGKKLAD